MLVENIINRKILAPSERYVLYFAPMELWNHYKIEFSTDITPL